MPAPSGRFLLGPDSATLSVGTGTAGAMAKAAHSLRIEVARWSAELELGDDPAAGSLVMDIDSGSLRVISGSGGAKPLTDDDKGKIAQIIDDRILHGESIAFRSTAIRSQEDGTYVVDGELTLMGATRPLPFTLTVDSDGHLAATAEVVQSAFGIEPYSAMMGALKVKDELTISVAGALPAPA